MSIRRHPVHALRGFRPLLLAGAAAAMTACGGGGGGASSGSDATSSGPSASTGAAAAGAGTVLTTVADASTASGSAGNGSANSSKAPAPDSAAAPAPAPESAVAPAPDASPDPDKAGAGPAPAPAPADPTVAKPTSVRDANRLAQQATFGPTEALVADVAARGPTAWLASQFKLSGSRYTLGGGDDIHRWMSQTANYCDGKPDTCWRDSFSSQPLLWDFYRNATQQPDQLRQRVAYALQQIVVVSGVEIEGTYGMRAYHNALMDNAFGNYRDVLKKVALSPVMGDYLNGVNNDKAAPNENFARELLQLFSIGTCALAADGSLQGGGCTPNYSNETVRNYAYALTGWTYPAGGQTSWGCWPQGTNCRYYGGDMTPVASYHDTSARALLSGVTVPAGSTAPQALEAVLDSLMQHPNMAPFIGRQLIQHLVVSNPSPAYVARVAAAFSSGSYGSFGSGKRGDLVATVAAVLLDAEARNESPGRSSGRLREPVLLFTSTLRALNGRTDGDPFGWWWGETLKQQVFRPPSVFNFYPPDYPLPGSTTLNGPEFALHNANGAIERLNYLMYLLVWGGSTPDASVPGAIGTQVDLSAFDATATDSAKLVDRLSLLATGQPLPAATRTAVVTAADAVNAQTSANWVRDRVKQAAYLVFGAPDFQVIR